MIIPVEAAKRIAHDFGYDQIIIIARKVGPGGNENVVTYGTNKECSDAAFKAGEFLKYKVMGWDPEKSQIVEDRRHEHLE
jgi:hypothetical protein